MTPIIHIPKNIRHDKPRDAKLIKMLSEICERIKNGEQCSIILPSAPGFEFELKE